MMWYDFISTSRVSAHCASFMSKLPLMRGEGVCISLVGKQPRKIILTGQKSSFLKNFTRWQKLSDHQFFTPTNLYKILNNFKIQTYKLTWQTNKHGTFSRAFQGRRQRANLTISRFAYMAHFFVWTKTRDDCICFRQSIKLHTNTFSTIFLFGKPKFESSKAPK